MRRALRHRISPGRSGQSRLRYANLSVQNVSGSCRGSPLPGCYDAQSSLWRSLPTAFPKAGVWSPPSKLASRPSALLCGLAFHSPKSPACCARSDDVSGLTLLSSEGAHLVGREPGPLVETVSPRNEQNGG